MKENCGQLFPTESWKVTLTPILGFVCSVRGHTILLECERVIFEMFLHFNMGWSQNIPNVQVCIQFGTLFNKNERGSPILRDGSPYHYQGRFLAAVNRIYGTGNAISTLSQNSVILQVELGLNNEDFFTRKDNFPSIHAILHSVQENLGSFHPLLLLQSVGVC